MIILFREPLSLAPCMQNNSNLLAALMAILKDAAGVGSNDVRNMKKMKR